MTALQSLPIKTYVINLDRTPDRYQFVKENLDRIGLPHQRFSAVDGANLTAEDWKKVDKLGYRLFHGKILREAEVGCYLSHTSVMEAFLKTDQPFCLILEDDCDFGDNFTKILAELIECKEEWDLAKLSGRHSGMPTVQKELSREYKLVAFLAKNTGASSYLINRHAAEQYLKKIFPMRVPYDHAFDRPWKFNIKFRAVLPFPSQGQEIKVSTITPDLSMQYKIKFKWYKRLLVGPYRIYQAVRRIWHFIINGLFIPKK